jgi:hypothetical protein
MVSLQTVRIWKEGHAADASAGRKNFEVLGDAEERLLRQNWEALDWFWRVQHQDNVDQEQLQWQFKPPGEQEGDHEFH